MLLTPTFSKLYDTNLTFASAFGIFYSVISVGGAFFIGSKILKSQKLLRSTPYNLPKDKTKTLLLIFSPLRVIINTFSVVISKLLGADPDKAKEEITDEELRKVIAAKTRYEVSTPLEEYPDSFITGWVQKYWTQIVDVIKASRIAE